MQPRERAPCCSAWLALEAVVMTNESALMCAYVQAMPAACSVCGHSHATRTQTAPCSRGRGSGVAVEQGHRARPRGTCAGRGAAAHLERLESLLLGPRVHHHHAEALGRPRGVRRLERLEQHLRHNVRVGVRQDHVAVVHLRTGSAPRRRAQHSETRAAHHVRHAPPDCASPTAGQHHSCSPGQGRR